MLARTIPLIDRYILRSMMQVYAAVVAVVLLLMSIENLPRLLSLAQNIDRYGAFLAESVISLIPGYAGLGLMIALFLSTALTFRRMALTSELDIWSASGCSNFRLMRAPVIVGCVTAILVLGIRCYLQPLGEENLDRIGTAVRVGEYGLGLKPDEFVRPAKGAMFTFDHAEASTGRLIGVFAELGGTTFVASSGIARYDANDRLSLLLERGTMIRRSKANRLDHTSFRTLSVVLPPEKLRRTGEPPRNQFDRLTFPALLGLADNGSLSAAARDAARAAIFERCGSGVFCVLLPLLGFVLGMPSRRGHSAFGLGLGILLIVAFIRMSVGIESNFAALAGVANATLAAVWAGMCALMLRLDHRAGHGFLEAWLSGLLRKFLVTS